MDLPTLLRFTKRIDASDLHLSAGAPPMVRLHGETRKLEIDGIDLSQPSAVRRILYGFLNESQKKRLEEDLEVDCAIEVGEDARFRANVFYQRRGLAGVFRVVPTRIPSAQELGLPPVLLDVADLERGLVLVTGPTGSGKSTTLAAMIDHINRTRRGHIVTIEDPIEFVHAPRRCMVNQREVRSHTRAFANALRSALREDPDVILVGEMRDSETIALAITAAETGHLVLGTVHTSSAAQTVDRIIKVFPSGEQAQVRTMLAESLQAVVAQVLVKRKGGGRVAAHEVLVATSGARSMIREEKSFQLPSIIQTGQRHGMMTLEQSLTALVRKGAVDREVAEQMLGALRIDDEEPLVDRSGAARRAAAPRVPLRRAPTDTAIRAVEPEPPTPTEAPGRSEHRLKLPPARRERGDVVFVMEGSVVVPPEVERPPLRVGSTPAGGAPPVRPAERSAERPPDDEELARVFPGAGGDAGPPAPQRPGPPGGQP